jgi:hypothetical protein
MTRPNRANNHSAGATDHHANPDSYAATVDANTAKFFGRARTIRGGGAGTRADSGPDRAPMAVLRSR